MAKYCGNCGFVLDENDAVCGNCGTRVEAPIAETGETPVGKEKLLSEKKRKVLKTVLASVIAVVVLVLGLNIVTSFIGYKGTVRKVMSAYKDYDVDALVDMSSDLYSYEDLGEMLEYRYDGLIAGDLDIFDNSMGGRYSLSYEIVRAQKLSDRQIKKAVEEQFYSSELPEGADAITGLTSVNVTVTAKHGKEKARQTLTIYLTKEDGDWKLFYMEG